jgi:hypothetical protein
MKNNDIHYSQVDHQIHAADSIFPLVVVNNNGIHDLQQWDAYLAANRNEFEAQLKRSGAILFRGFPVTSAETFDHFSAAFGYPNFTYKESLSNAVRINYTERVFTANEAPKDVEIFLHHEMAQTPISPTKVFFFCKSAAEHGGATPLCRSDMLFSALQEQSPKLAKEFQDKGLKYTTHMPSADNLQSGQGRSWKSTLSVEDQGQAETKLAGLGYTWVWSDDGSLRATTSVLPAVVTLDSGKSVFYNQIVAAFLGWNGVRENPSSAITFGDGSAIPIAGLELIVALAEQFTFDLPWQDGDVALVDNYLTMHGRRPFSGERKREVLVALAMK